MEFEAQALTLMFKSNDRLLVEEKSPIPNFWPRPFFFLELLTHFCLEAEEKQAKVKKGT